MGQAFVAYRRRNEPIADRRWTDEAKAATKQRSKGPRAGVDELIIVLLAVRFGHVGLRPFSSCRGSARLLATRPNPRSRRRCSRFSSRSAAPAGGPRPRGALRQATRSLDGVEGVG